MRIRAGRLQRNWDLAVLVLLVAHGAWLRFASLGAGSLWIDEGFSVVHARAILEHGYPRLPAGAVSWNYFPAHYLMALGLRLFANLHLGARFFSALAGVAVIPAVYLLGREVCRRRIGPILAAALVCYLSYEVGWSRQARMYVLLQLLTVMAVATFWRFLRHPGRRALSLSAAFGVLAVFTHRAGFLVPVAVFGAALCRGPGGARWRTWLRAHAGATALCAVVVVSAVVVFRGATAASSVADTVRHVAQQGGQSYALSYAQFLYSQLGGCLAWAAAGMVLGTLLRPSLAAPLCLAVLVYFLAVANRTLLFHFRYMLPILPFAALFAGLAADLIVEYSLRSRAGRLRTVPLLCVALFLAALATARTTWRPEPWYRLGISAPQPDWQRAYAWVQAHHDRFLADEPAIDTISTFPMFHDLYLDTPGRKCFLPFSITGLRDDFREEPRYARAHVVDTLVELQMQEGYLVLDDLGLRTLKNEETWDFLTKHRPDHIVCSEGPYHVFIWKWF